MTDRKLTLLRKEFEKRITKGIIDRDRIYIVMSALYKHGCFLKFLGEEITFSRIMNTDNQETYEILFTTASNATLSVNTALNEDGNAIYHIEIEENYEICYSKDICDNCE